MLFSLTHYKKNKMKKTSSGIQAFISYRRETGREVARNIYERLSFTGINTFFDYNSMRNGKFNEQIYDAIEQAKDFILILSKGALDRCDNPNDWVRMEIEHALKLKKEPIIVCTEPTVSFPDNLPDSLKDLPLYNAITLNQEYYDEGIARLLNMMAGYNPISERIKGWLKKFWWVVVGIVCVAVITLSFEFNNMAEPSPQLPMEKSGLRAKIYLPRYADLDREVLDKHWFAPDVLKNFEYVDTIINNQYFIYPHSAYFTDNVSKSLSVIQNFTPSFHNLPLRLSIHNTKPNTIVFNNAELEIIEIHPIATPYISICRNSDKLNFINQTESFTPHYNLSYSFLAPGESFVQFKNSENISASSYSLPLENHDSIVGKITCDQYNWRFNYSASADAVNNRQAPNNSPANILPASSNVKVFCVNINSMEAPRLYQLKQFSRQVCKGEVDDDLYMIIKSDFSFDAKIRVKLIKVDGTNVFYTDPINIRYIKPISYENAPF